MKNQTKKNTNKGLKLMYFLVSILVIIALPFILIIRALESLLKVNILKIDDSKKRGIVGTFVVKYWLGNTYEAQKNRVFVYFILPSFTAFSLFVALPFLQGIYFSMTDWNGLNDPTFIGLDNYKTILHDYSFGYSFFRTALYSILNIFVINIIAFSLALIVTQKLKLQNIYRAGFFLPNLIGGLVLGYIWQFIFNRVLVQFGGIFESSLLINGNTALVGLIIVVTWQYAGYIMMIYIAAIQNVPQDLIEASEIDGANAWQRLRTITLPLVAQAFTVSMFLTLVTSFKQYDTVVSLTHGGPATQLPSWLGMIYNKTLLPVVQSTDLIAVNIYDEAFVNRNMGVGQAKSIIFFIILLVVALIQVYYNKRKEVEL